MTTPSVDCRTYAVPKEDEQAEDYEDASAVSGERWPVRAAAADGATESVYAGRWASLLAEGLVKVGATPGALAEALPDWQARWRVSVDPPDDAPWYVEAKAREGAHAALLGLEIEKDGRWRAVAVGDCGLVHVRNTDRIEAWPTADPDAFTNRPALLPSHPHGAAPAPEATTGTWQPGDTFLLATDAVAAWLLRTDPAALLPASENTFRTAVREARADGALRSDDATLVVLNMRAPDPSNPRAAAP